MLWSRLFLVLPILFCPIIGQATTISFLATDLTDVTPGENLWRYEYTVSGRTFAQSEFFDIYFDAALYKMLDAGPAPTADWDVLVLQQPNPVNLPPFDRGIFDAFALSDSPSLAGTFSVSFVFLGPGSPGAQPFEIFDTNVNLAESGFTTPLAAEIPEPSTATLFFLGLAACAIRFHSKPGAGL